MQGAIKIKTNKDNGGIYIADTGTYVGDFGSIYAHSAAVVEVISSNIGTGASSVITGATGAAPVTHSSVAIPAGSTYWGKFTSVKPASGQVTIYYANQR